MSPRSHKRIRVTSKMMNRAYRQVRGGGRKAPGPDGMTVSTFDTDAKAQLKSIACELNSGTYQPGPTFRVEIRGGRSVHVLNLRDKIAQRVVRMLLVSAVEIRMHPSAHGSRSGHATWPAIVRTSQLIHHYKRAVVFDIASCYGSIDRPTLADMLRTCGVRKIEGIVELVELFMTVPTVAPSGRTIDAGIERTGLIQGAPISDLLANLYLTIAVDDWLESHPAVGEFTRWMDDVIVHLDKSGDVAALLESLPRQLARFSLTTHRKKLQVGSAVGGRCSTREVLFMRRPFRWE